MASAATVVEPSGSPSHGRIALITDRPARGRVPASVVPSVAVICVTLLHLSADDNGAIADGIPIGCRTTLVDVATGTPATTLLTKAKIAFTLHPYEHDPRSQAYGDEAAAALGTDPRQLFKTLIAAVDGVPACAVVPVAARLGLKAFAAALGAKRAELAPPEVAARVTGYVVGGISPLAQKSRLRVVVDDSALGFGTVFVSAGRRGLQLELAPSDLVAATGAQVAAIAT